MSKPRKTTPLQLYRQHAKIQALKQKLHAEEDKLLEMISHASFHRTKINIDGVIYELTASNSHYRWNNRLMVDKLGTAEEFARLSA